MPLPISVSLSAEFAPCSNVFAVLSPSIVEMCASKVMDSSFGSQDSEKTVLRYPKSIGQRVSSFWL